MTFANIAAYTSTHWFATGVAACTDMHLVPTYCKAPGGASSSRVVARQASGVAMHTPPHHFHLQLTTCPCQHLRLAPNLARILSNSLMTYLQRIRVQWLDPPQYHQNQLRPTQGFYSTHRHFGLTQTIPPTGLSATRFPLPCRTMPNVKQWVASPRSEHTKNVKDQMMQADPAWLATLEHSKVIQGHSLV